MFSCLLNQSEHQLLLIEKIYLEKSLNLNHQRAREKVCLEIRRLFSIPFAPLIQKPNGELVFLDREWKISVTNKNENAAIILSRHYESVGIDIEYFNNDTDWTAFHGRFFNREDWILAHQISSQNKITLAQSFTLLFSAKEAILKALSLRIDPLLIVLKKSTIFFPKEGHLQFFSNLNSIVEIKWPLPNTQFTYIISLCVIEKNDDRTSCSIFNDPKLFVNVLL